MHCLRFFAYSNRNLPRTAYMLGPEMDPKWPDGICNDMPIDIRENDVRWWLIGDRDSISTSGQEDRCACWNFGWYGSNILILPQRLKNNAIAATHNINTSTTIRTSSARTIIFGPSENLDFFVVVFECWTLWCS